MSVDDLTNIRWLEPWEPAPKGLEAELMRETGPGHPLFGRDAVCVGRRGDCDDVLFFLPGNADPLAVVHLTWKPETNPSWPRTTFYSSLEDWVERCMRPDHLKFRSASE